VQVASPRDQRNCTRFRPRSPLLLLQDIIVTFGVTPLLSGAELAVAAGDRVCLVGRNGSGKSKLALNAGWDLEFVGFLYSIKKEGTPASFQY
jgi:ABC-type molybdenum transport system ATPase subunit/photorepair protein PhrA